MRCFVLAAMALAASADLTRVHRAAVIPQGWKATDGEVPKDFSFKVNIGLKRSNPERLSALLDDVSNPRGQHYLNYPTYEEIGDLVRPSKENSQKVFNWLAAHGVVVESVHPHGDYIHAIATVAQIEAMANGKFQTYTNPTQGTIFRLTSGVHVQSDVADVIDIFAGFHGFPLPYEPKKVKAGAAGDVNPTVFRNTYNISAVAHTGSKKNIQAIAQFQGQYIVEKSLDNFCNEYNGGTTCAITKFIGRNLPIAGVESMLDSEYILAIGNLTETWAYSYPSTDFCTDLTTFGSNVTGETEYPSTISVSYGSQFIDFCEQAVMTRFSQDIQKMGTMGITVMISSGDDGSGGQTRQGSNGGKLSPSFPASIPYCVAVGGTYFVEGVKGEQQATTQFGSGGGFSYDFPVPSYQADGVKEYLSKVTLPSLSYATGRGTPDVSALAESFTVVSTTGTLAVGGTSCSSPAFAGMLTLLNNACLTAGGKTLGFINPLFYQNPNLFTDITKGTNAIGENSAAGWEAIAGWDASTGLGVPNFPAMLQMVRNQCAQALPNV